MDITESPVMSTKQYDQWIPCGQCGMTMQRMLVVRTAIYQCMTCGKFMICSSECYKKAGLPIKEAERRLRARGVEPLQWDQKKLKWGHSLNITGHYDE